MSGHKAVGDGEQYDNDGNKQYPEKDPYEDDDTLSQDELARIKALLDAEKWSLEGNSFAARLISVVAGSLVGAGITALGCATVALCVAGARTSLALGLGIEEEIYANLLGNDIEAITHLSDYLDSAMGLEQDEYNFIITETEKKL